MNEPREKLKKLGHVFYLLGMLFWLAMPASFLYYRHLLKVCPTSPDGSMCVEFCEHGHYFYVTPVQSMVFHGLLCGGGLGFILFALVGALLRRESPFNPSDSN